MLNCDARYVSKHEDPSLLLAKVKEYLDFLNLIWPPYLKQHPVLYEALHSMHHVKSADTCDWAEGSSLCGNETCHGVSPPGSSIR